MFTPLRTIESLYFIFIFREAKLNGHVCPQHMYYKPDIWIGEEDCLWLNVYTRDLVVKKRRPVIVWIHGGNFVRGSAADYEPDYILDQDVVLVTIQYRLGMFGFLSTESFEAPGNYGMLDQVAALKWVNENIEAFSGDPNRLVITLIFFSRAILRVFFFFLKTFIIGLRLWVNRQEVHRYIIIC